METFLRFQLRRFPVLHGAARSLKLSCRSFLDWATGVVRRLPNPLGFGLPCGIYSDYELLRDGPEPQEGRIAVTNQGNPPAPPDSMMLRARKNQHAYQPWPVFWIKLKDVELVGTSLAHLDRRGYISQESIYARSLDSHATKDPSYFYFRGPRWRAKKLEGNWTSVVSSWMSTDRTWPYGHWLKDSLPRLALLPEFPPDTRILLPPVKLPFQVASLRMLGVLDRCRWTSDQHLQVENYYFSAPPSMIASYSPYVVNWLRDTFLPRVRPPTPDLPRRLYLRRVGDIRNVANEAEVLEFFRKLGWAIVDTAAIPFEEQIRLFAQAEAICGPHGSGFSNLIWSSTGCKVLELFGDAHLCATTEWICHCLPPTQHRYLVFPSDHRMNAIVDMPSLRKALAAYDLL